tara:strand:- start:186 stop:521 length:336 start_codon:yes stop_codon:yes gene_type:complete
MTTINRDGFTQTGLGLEIDKDVEAKLTYTFDWSSWLSTGDSLASAVYSVAARRNDPTPVVIETSGTQGNKSFVQLSAGQIDRTYIVTCKVTTTDGAIDRRNFRLNVKTRSA